VKHRGCWSKLLVLLVLLLLLLLDVMPASFLLQALAY
jgi:hypothetical protein